MKWITRLKEAARSGPDRRAAEPVDSGAPQAQVLPSVGDDRLQTLTPREREVFTLLVQGKKMWEAAEILGVKLTTISFHCTALYKKLDVHDRVQLILRYGLAEGAKDALASAEGDAK